MLIDFDLSGWIPTTPLEWVFSVAALCSIGMFLSVVWSAAKRVLPRFRALIRAGSVDKEIEWLLDDAMSAIEFRLHPHKLASVALNRIARLFFWLAALVFIAIASPKDGIGWILALGPISFILRDTTRIRMVMLATHDPHEYTQTVIANVERQVGRLKSTDPDVVKVREYLSERLAKLKVMDGMVAKIQTAFDDRALRDDADRAEKGEATKDGGQ